MQTISTADVMPVDPWFCPGELLPTPRPGGVFNATALVALTADDMLLSLRKKTPGHYSKS